MQHRSLGTQNNVCRILAKSRRGGARPTQHDLREDRDSPTKEKSRSTSRGRPLPFRAARARPIGPVGSQAPIVVEIARSRFESGHFADSVEAALKEVNDMIRQIVRDQIGKSSTGPT